MPGPRRTPRTGPPSGATPASPTSSLLSGRPPRTTKENPGRTPNAADGSILDLPRPGERAWLVPGLAGGLALAALLVWAPWCVAVLLGLLALGTLGSWGLHYDRVALPLPREESPAAGADLRSSLAELLARVGPHEAQVRLLRDVRGGEQLLASLPSGGWEAAEVEALARGRGFAWSDGPDGGLPGSPLRSRLAELRATLEQWSSIARMGGVEGHRSRSDALEKLPRDLPPQARPLLDEVHRETTSGVVLWVLDELYRLLPGPPPDLFRFLDPARRREASALLEPLWRPVEPGRFEMGSPDDEDGRNAAEGPRHAVALRQPLRVQAVPVTNALYELYDPAHARERAFAGAPDLDRHPAVNLSWWEATLFARWLGARLPTECELEHFARAGTDTPFWSGAAEADLARVGCYAGNSERRTHPVGERPANPWGLFDVHGNVWEWCADQYGRPHDEPLAEPHRPWEPGDRTARRVLRGGAWGDGARGCRAACRGGRRPGGRYPDVGFRLVRPGQ